MLCLQMALHSVPAAKRRPPLPCAPGHRYVGIFIAAWLTGHASLLNALMRTSPADAVRALGGPYFSTHM